MIFFGRLSLAVQTVSNFKAGEKSFMPIQKDLDIQTFVKVLLYNQPISDPAFAKGISKELSLCITEVKWMTDKKNYHSPIKWFRYDRLDMGSVSG